MAAVTTGWATNRTTPDCTVAATWKFPVATVDGKRVASPVSAVLSPLCRLLAEQLVAQLDARASNCEAWAID